MRLRREAAAEQEHVACGFAWRKEVRMHQMGIARAEKHNPLKGHHHQPVEKDNQGPPQVGSNPKFDGRQSKIRNPSWKWMVFGQLLFFSYLHYSVHLGSQHTPLCYWCFHCSWCEAMKIWGNSLWCPQMANSSIMIGNIAKTMTKQHTLLPPFLKFSLKQLLKVTWKHYHYT